MNKYEKIFTKEDGEDIDLSYELKKANYVIRNLIDQRNSTLNELAMVRAECFMLNEELEKYREKYKETETEEEIKKENEEEELNAEE
jgi:peptide subunit release factor 1 (eRF1)